MADMNAVGKFWDFMLGINRDCLERMRVSYYNGQNILSNNGTTTVNNYAGNRSIEDVVASQVASNGAQLGWLSEIVLALVDKASLKEPSGDVRHLTEAVARIKKIKESVNYVAISKAESALDDLKENNQDEFKNIMIKYHASSARAEEALKTLMRDNPDEFQNVVEKYYAKAKKLPVSKL